MEQRIGRRRETQQLELAMSSNRSELVVLFGRRRIGKTFLVRSFFNDTFTFRFVGAHKKTRKVQLSNFRDSLQRTIGKEIGELKDWREAFSQLALALEQSDDRRKVIFFDELPWADVQGGGLINELEYFWANWVETRDDIVMIVCGSASTWMKEKLLKNRGSLHNRVTRKIYLRPFHLSECREYLNEHNIEWDDFQIMQFYMVFGGVPYYLSLLRSNLSLVENIDALLFAADGLLHDEFQELYHALFSNAESYITVVSKLSESLKGFTRSEIEKATGISGGTLTRILQNLELCDFITSYNQFGNSTKLCIYKMSDFFTMFYFRFMKDNRSRDEHYWQHHFMDRSVQSWQGFAFEQLCVRHLGQIKHGLGISGIATESSSWRYVAPEGEGRKGAQIDLVIKRVDRVIHLCEMKFTDQTFTITADYEARMNERRQLFRQVTGVRQSVVLTMVTPFGITPGKHTGNIHSTISSKELFSEI